MEVKLGDTTSVIDSTETVLSGSSFFNYAPETLSNTVSFSKAADIFSFGMTVYEIVMGDLPKEFFSLEKNERPIIPADCNKHFARLIEWCWQQEPEKRPAIDEVLNYLFGLVHQFTFQSPHSPSGTKLSTC